MQGPFYNPDAEPQTPSSRSLVRAWSQLDKSSVPDDVGRKGRLKSKAALQKQADDAENGLDDWFSNSTRKVRSSNQAMSDPRRLSFKFIGRDEFMEERREPPSLMERMGIQRRDDYQRTNKREHRDKSSNGSRYRDERRSSGNHVDKHYGPRYRGGYGK